MPIYCFLLVQFPLHHATSFLVQVSTFKHDDISTLKTFLGGSLQHSHVMTFLYLKVHNGWHKFSIGSVLPSPCHFQHSSMMMFLCLKHLWVDIHAWWPFCTPKKKPGKIHKNSLTHSRVTANQLLRRVYESTKLSRGEPAIMDLLVYTLLAERSAL